MKTDGIDKPAYMSHSACQRFNTACYNAYTLRSNNAKYLPTCINVLDQLDASKPVPRIPQDNEPSINLGKISKREKKEKKGNVKRIRPFY